MAQLADYDTLKAAVLTWSARSDTTFRSQFDVLLALAEERLYLGAGKIDDPTFTEPLRSSVMETTGTITMTDGEGDVPSNCLGFVKLYPTGGTIGTTGVTPERFAELDATLSGGQTLYHTVEARRIKVLPRLTGNLEATYYQRFDAITSSNKTGPLIIEHGLIYLPAVLFEGFSFMQEADLAAGHLARMRGMIAGANKTGVDLTFSGPQRVRPRVVIGG